MDAIPPLSALAQPARLELFMTIARHKEGIGATEAAELSGVNLSTASAHLTILRNAGLVTSERIGRAIIYTAVRARLRAVVEFLGAIAK